MSSYRASVTPIFDEVDRRWRKDDDTDGTAAATPSMLSFTGAATDDRRTPAPPRRESGPRHALRR